MNAFRGLIKQIRGEIEEVRAKEAFLALLGEGDDVERAITQKKAELDALAKDEAAVRQRIADASDAAARIMAGAEEDARLVRAAAEREKDGAIAAAVMEALAKTGDEAAAIVATARKQAEMAEQEASARLSGLNEESAAATAERDKALAELRSIRNQIADAVAERRKLAESLVGAG
jgi:hypothetical protein